jgi:chemotaxis protein CheY-P-specific phosphatase CheC
VTGWAGRALQSAVARDALCELVNIGSGNALTSLTRLIGGGRIALEVPDCVSGHQVNALTGLDAEGIVVRMKVEGAVAATFLAAFEHASALRLAQVLLAVAELPERLGEHGESAILEAVNICSCSFLGALGSLLRGVLVPSPPFAMYGPLADLVSKEVAEPEETVVLSSRFEDANGGFRGRILLTAGGEATSRMLEAVGIEP